jgi:hypothetical protein
MDNHPTLPGVIVETPPVPRQQRGKTFLAANARFFDCFTQSVTLRDCANKAAKLAQSKAGSGRNSAALFEEKLCELLLDPANRDKIAAETIAFADEHCPEMKLVTVSIEESPGNTGLADIIVRYRTDKARTVALATNIKRLLPSARSTEGGSIPQICQLALEDEFDPATPPSPVGFDWERAIVEWYARRRKIQDGRDYWLLVCRVEDGACEGVEAWGALSGLRGETVVVSRHSSRAVTNISEPTAILGDDIDINHGIAQALLPPANASALRALIVSFVDKREGSEKAEQVANTVLDLSDSDLLTAVINSVR